MSTRYDPRADKITVAITEAIIASQRDDDHPSLLTLRRIPRLRRWRWSPAGARSGRRSPTLPPRALRSRRSTPRWGKKKEALQQSGDQHPFARVRHDDAHVNGTVEPDLVAPSRE